MATVRLDSVVDEETAIEKSRTSPNPASLPLQAEAVEAIAELNKHRAVLARVKKWHAWNEAKRKSPLGHILSKVDYRQRPKCPCKQELLQLALYYFPPRATLKAIICDFGDDRFERSEQDLGRIDSSWESKPGWADTIGHRFLNAGPEYASNFGQDYNNYSSPQLHFEVLNFRHQEYLQDQADVFNILRLLPGLTSTLDGYTWAPGVWDASLYSDIITRSHEYTASINFWDLVRSDLPSQLTEGNDDDLYFTSTSPPISIDAQMLSQHRAYSQAMLVRDAFRTFRRSDGFLLTQSSMVGLHRCHPGFLAKLTKPPSIGSFDLKYNVLEELRVRWSGSSSSGTGLTGSSRWEDAKVEWLLLYIVSELDGTPYCHRSPDIQKAYIPIARNLKRSRGLPFKKNESMKLVREFIACMNEVSQVLEITEQKVQRLENLAMSWQEFSRDLVLQDYPEVAMKDLLQKRIYWTKRKSENLPRILNDLKSSMDVLFQLRTIEQNELALIAESNNRAILVFTFVTIIFLPLSFFTSYFGMNLKGVIDTDRTEHYFWAVCGSVTVCVISLTILCGFRHRLVTWIWKDRESGRSRTAELRGY